MNGLALNLQALTSVESALTRVAGFAPAKAGGTQRDAEGTLAVQFYPRRERALMRISIRRSQAVLPILLAMGLSGFGVALWCDLPGRRWRQCPAMPRPANAVAPGDGIAHARR